MTIGATCELKINTAGILDIPLYHRIPNKAFAERMAVEVKFLKSRVIVYGGY